VECYYLEVGRVMSIFKSKHQALFLMNSEATAYTRPRPLRGLNIPGNELTFG